MRLIGRLLLYFSCMSAQIVAARAWHLEHPPFHDPTAKGPYRIAGFVADIFEWTKTIGELDAYVAGKRKRYPSRKLVTDLKPLATQWQNSLGLSDHEIRIAARRIYPRMRYAVRSARKWAERNMRRAKAKDVTLHKEVFGFTSAETLAFLATRLIQLRNATLDLLQDVRQKRAPNFTLDYSSFPPVNDTDVADVLFVMRVSLLDDSSSIHGGPARQRTSHNADLSAQITKHAVNGGLIGQDLIAKSRKHLTEDRLPRPPILSRKDGRLRRLTRGQSLDVLPEYWLQTPKVTPGPLNLQQILAIKREVDEEKRRNRPANIRKASGKR